MAKADVCVKRRRFFFFLKNTFQNLSRNLYLIKNTLPTSKGHALFFLSTAENPSRFDERLHALTAKPTTLLMQELQRPAALVV